MSSIHQATEPQIPPLSFSDAAIMPTRERALLEELRDPTLVWKQEQRSTPQTWPIRPVGYRFNRLEKESYGPTHGRGVSAPGDDSYLHQHFGGAHRDWNRVDTASLCANTELYQMKLLKCAIDWYSHQQRRGENKVVYEAYIIPLDGHNQPIILTHSTHPELAAIFEEILKRTPKNQ